MQNEILALMNKTGEDDVFANIIYNLMVHTHQPYSEIMKMPFPLVIKLLEIMKKENDRMEKESRRRR
jgi:hypothetical protein